ncbi:MAG: FeoA family protein [Verrucomicrobiota bacterium]
MPASPTPLTLCSARCGQRLRILCLNGSSQECARLRELGFCEYSEVCKLTDGSALLCRLSGSRLALGRELGARILVEPIAA